MKKTLQLYLSRDLLKVTLLALVALTLVLTVFAIVEPLRKQQGMAPAQVVALFGYMLPITVSLTLPIAALFATTIVYGRFSQDNELLACRASGIGTLSLLRPALVLGLLVTGVSLILANFVAPRMTANTKAIIKNIKGITYTAFRNKGVIKISDRGMSMLIHADGVDERNDVLTGVVVAETSKVADVKFLAAAAAKLTFIDESDQYYLQVALDNPRATEVRNSSLMQEQSQTLIFPVPNPVKESPAFLDWDRLVETMGNPLLNGNIQREMEKVRRELCHDMLLRRVEKAINSSHVYAELRSDPSLAEGPRQYVIKAEHADFHEAGAKRGSRPFVRVWGDGQGAPVLTIIEGGKTTTYTGGTGSQIILDVLVPKTSLASLVFLTFEAGLEPLKVAVEDRSSRPATVAAAGPREPGRTRLFQAGELPIPADLVQSVSKIAPAGLYSDPEDYTSSPAILADLNKIKSEGVRRLINEILAEMHSRVAYSVSCLLLVSLGGALGLMFRGGQFISAFAISAVPGAAVIVMILAGKTMLQNPGVNPTWGLVCIWSGIVTLLAANLIVYVRLARK